MVAYIIGIRRKTHDANEMEAYAAAAAAKPFLRKARPKILARYGTHEDVESQPIEGVILLEFPTFKEAQDWYHSPDYQEVRQHRLKGADYQLIIVDGV